MESRKNYEQKMGTRKGKIPVIIEKLYGRKRYIGK